MVGYKAGAGGETMTISCNVCGEEKPADSDHFYTNKSSKLGFSKTCIPCYLARSKEYSKAHEARLRVTSAEWRQANKESFTAYQRNWYKENRGRILAKNVRLRFDVLAHYSKGTLSCQCCGEGHLEFLALDHISGGGLQHRKAHGYTSLDRWLFQQGMPDGYRVLCHNCNQARGLYGACPHEGDTHAFDAVLPYLQAHVDNALAKARAGAAVLRETVRRDAEVWRIVQNVRNMSGEIVMSPTLAKDRQRACEQALEGSSQ